MRSFDLFYGTGRRTVVVLLIGAAALASSPRGGAAQTHLAGGVTWGAGHTGPLAEVGYRKGLGASPRWALGAAALVGNPGATFAVAEARFEFVLDPTSIMSPFVGARAGILTAEQASDAVWGFVAGLAPRIREGRRLRVAWLWSRVEGGRGPHAFTVGLEFRR